MINTKEYLLGRCNKSAGLPYEISGSPEKEELLTIFRDLNFTTGAEIGVHDGRHARKMIESVPGLKLYGIDAWKAYSGYRGHYDQSRWDAVYEGAKQRVSGFNCELVRGFSMDMLKQFKDNSLDFVFIDGNHEFQQVINDVAEWSKKVRRGGIISGHDFAFNIKSAGECFHVKEAVSAWAQAKKINPWFFVTGYNGPSWLWVR